MKTDDEVQLSFTQRVLVWPFGCISKDLLPWNGKIFTVDVSARFVSRKKNPPRVSGKNQKVQSDSVKASWWDWTNTEICLMRLQNWTYWKFVTLCGSSIGQIFSSRKSFQVVSKRPHSNKWSTSFFTKSRGSIHSEATSSSCTARNQEVQARGATRSWNQWPLGCYWRGISFLFFQSWHWRFFSAGNKFSLSWFCKSLVTRCSASWVATGCATLLMLPLRPPGSSGFWLKLQPHIWSASVCGRCSPFTPIPTPFQKLSRGSLPDRRITLFQRI